MWYVRIPVRIVGLNGVKIPITIPMDPWLFSYQVVRRQQMIMLMYHKSTAYVCVCVCVCVCVRMFSCLTIIWTCVCTVPWLVTYHVHAQYHVQVDRFWFPTFSSKFSTYVLHFFDVNLISPTWQLIKLRDHKLAARCCIMFHLEFASWRNISHGPIVSPLGILKSCEGNLQT